MKRKAITKKTRFEIFKRDSFSCQYCGATPPSVTLHVDHIHPVSKGGGNENSNLVTSCSSCNVGKSDIPLDIVGGSLQEKAALIKEREAQIKGYYKAIAESKKRVDRESWLIAAAMNGSEYVESYNSNRLKSISMFLEKTDFYSVLDAAEIAANKFNCSDSFDQFKYFCGICWKTIKEATQ